MPELPEVETTRRGIFPHVQGQNIAQVVVRESRLRWAVPADLNQQLEGRRITDVLRRGKYLILPCEREADVRFLIIHLGMSGNLRLVDKSIALKKHDHIDWVLDNGLILRYHDPRRFGAVLSTYDWQQHELITRLGVEPLSTDFDAAYLYQRAQNKRQAVKNFLMDSHQVVGVGNIYASESLFQAKIHPAQAAGTVSEAAYQRLVTAVVAVLQAAIEQGGTSLRDFRQSDGKPGYFKQSLQVYGRAGEPCLICKQSVEQIRLGQRGSYFCPQCQAMR